MDFEKLRYIICIEEEGSFTKAAQRLYISQPALSQYIISLEEEFGIKFFDRKSKPLKLTSAGELVMKRGLEILNMKKELCEELKNISKKGITTLSIGVSANRSPYFLSFLLPKLTEIFPNLKIRLVEKSSKELESSLLNGQLDIALLSLPLLNKGLEYVKFFKEEIFLFTGKNEKYQRLSKEKLLKLENLKDEKFILLSTKQKLRNVIENLFLEKNFNPNIFLETESQETILSLVENNLGVGFASNLILQSQKYNGTFISISLGEKNLTREFAVTYKAGRKLNNIEEKVIEILLQKSQ